jgi:hypothetical protein
MSGLLNCKGILALSVFILGCMGLVGSFGLDITDKYTLGPGGAPLVYSIGTIFTSIILGVSSLRHERQYSSSSMPLTSSGKKGFFFVIILFASAGMIYVLGYPIVLFCLSFIGLILAEGWKTSKALIFSTIWIIALYVLFVKILKVRLMAGILF